MKRKKEGAEVDERCKGKETDRLCDKDRKDNETKEE